MRRGGSMWGRAIVVAVVAAIVTPAWAGGSLGLDEAIAEIFVADPALVAEIEAAVKRDGRAAEDIVCVAGNRLGSAWTMLGGVRVLPIDCAIDGRTLHVEGRVVFRDGRGRVLEGYGPKTRTAAESVEQTDLHWVWK